MFLRKNIQKKSRFFSQKYSTEMQTCIWYQKYRMKLRKMSGYLTLIIIDMKVETYG